MKQLCFIRFVKGGLILTPSGVDVIMYSVQKCGPRLYLISFLCYLQTKMEYNRLLGAKINGPINRRGKIASAQSLRINANRLGLTNVDYRAQGYVTEVKDQVGF